MFHSDAGSVGYYLAAMNGSTVQAIAIPLGAGDQWSMSQDGSKLVYTSWADGPGLDGRLHVININTGSDRLLTPVGDGYEWLNPGFSPDGTQIMAERYVATATGQYHVVVLPVDGTRPAIEIGPAHDSGTDGAQKQFSPDGTSILAMYKQDGSSWLLDAAGGPGRQLDWSYTGGPAWQRLAP